MTEPKIERAATMTNRIYPSACLALLLATPCLGEEAAKADREIACAYFHKSPMTSGGAKLAIAGGKINHVHFNTYYPGGVGTLGFTCDIDWNRGDADYAWQDNPAGAVITVKKTGDTVLVRHDKKKKGYVLDFANLNKLSKWCGAGADVPEDVFIPLAGKTCKVTMPR